MPDRLVIASQVSLGATTYVFEQSSPAVPKQMVLEEGGRESQHIGNGNGKLDLPGQRRGWNTQH